MTEIELLIPGVVFRECLDPRVTNVPDESGWPRPERKQRVGAGYQHVYRVRHAIALEIIEHVRDFGEGLSYGVDDPAIGRSLVRWAERTSRQLDDCGKVQ